MTKKRTKVDKFLKTERGRMILSKSIDFISQRRSVASQRPNSGLPQNAGHLTEISNAHWTHTVRHGLPMHDIHFESWISAAKNRFNVKLHRFHDNERRCIGRMWVTVSWSRTLA